MSKDGSSDSYFNEKTRHSLVQTFAVCYFNREVKPDLAQKGRTGANAEFSVHYSSLDKYPKETVWSCKLQSYSSYDYYMVLKDERFSELDELLDKYSDRIEVPESEKALIEKKLYSLTLLMMKEDRLPHSFRLEPVHDAEMNNLASKLERTTKLLDNLERRIANIEKNPFLKTGITK
ncbi:MAG: hypothetical protein JRN12_03475 [Nitrososphaerota archaeon]|nr:hypothetical protein [Nitrososphaerota archaeon]